MVLLRHLIEAVLTGKKLKEDETVKFKTKCPKCGTRYPYVEGEPAGAGCPECHPKTEDYNVDKWRKQGRYKTDQGRRAHTDYDPQHGTVLSHEPEADWKKRMDKKKPVKKEATQEEPYMRILRNKMAQSKKMANWKVCPDCEGDSADDTALGDCPTCHGRGKVPNKVKSEARLREDWPSLQDKQMKKLNKLVQNGAPTVKRVCSHCGKNAHAVDLGSKFGSRQYGCLNCSLVSTPKSDVKEAAPSSGFPYKCQDCGSKVTSAGQAPKNLGLCRDCYADLRFGTDEKHYPKRESYDRSQGALRLQCDMKRDCTNPVTHIGEKGYVYCSQHAPQRKGHERTRRLQPQELEKLKSGQPLHRYEKESKNEATVDFYDLKVGKRVQTPDGPGTIVHTGTGSMSGAVDVKLDSGKTIVVRSHELQDESKEVTEEKGFCPFCHEPFSADETCHNPDCFDTPQKEATMYLNTQNEDYTEEFGDFPPRIQRFLQKMSKSLGPSVAEVAGELLDGEDAEEKNQSVLSKIQQYCERHSEDEGSGELMDILDGVVSEDTIGEWGGPDPNEVPYDDPKERDRQSDRRIYQAVRDENVKPPSGKDV